MDKFEQSLKETAKRKKYFAKKFPKLITSRTDFWLSTGWKQLFEGLCTKLEPYKIEIAQVKSKFAKLVVHVNREQEHKLQPEEQAEIYAFIHDSERESGTICEVCGERASLDDSKSRVVTVCDEHREAWKHATFLEDIE